MLSTAVPFPFLPIKSYNNVGSISFNLGDLGRVMGRGDILSGEWVDPGNQINVLQREIEYG